MAGWLRGEKLGRTGMGGVVGWEGWERMGRMAYFHFPHLSPRENNVGSVASRVPSRLRTPSIYFGGVPGLRYPAASCVTPSPPNSPCLVDFARFCSQNRQHGPAQTPRSALRPSRPFQKGCVGILSWPHAPHALNAALQNPARASSESTLSLRRGAPPVPSHVFWSSARRSPRPCLPQVRATLRAPLDDDAWPMASCSTTAMTPGMEEAVFVVGMTLLVAGFRG